MMCKDYTYRVSRVSYFWLQQRVYLRDTDTWLRSVERNLVPLTLATNVPN